LPNLLCRFYWQRNNGLFHTDEEVLTGQHCRRYRIVQSLAQGQVCSVFQWYAAQVYHRLLIVLPGAEPRVTARTHCTVWPCRQMQPVLPTRK
jgi:hypothetical protein